MPHHRSLHEPHKQLRFVHFPNQGLISLVAVMKDGRTVETGIVGNEGVSGIAAAVGLNRGPLREIVQIAGDGFRVRVAEFQETLPSTPQLRNLLGRYVMVLGMQVGQTAACNRLHRIEQRLARWLLMAQDRLDSGTLPITHDFLATMLGTDRASVTLAAGILQRLQLVSYTRGAVKILERMKLEKFACECYGIIRQYNGEL
jgi:CRP-like cAMP-binding protein